MTVGAGTDAVWATVVALTVWDALTVGACTAAVAVTVAGEATESALTVLGVGTDAVRAIAAGLACAVVVT